MLQAKITLEAQQLKRADVTSCCQEAGVTYVHTRTVSSETMIGKIMIPVRTFQCNGCGALFRPDDGTLGVPEAGDLTGDVRLSTRQWPRSCRIGWPTPSSRGAQG
jgi:hypothetical protein